MFILTIVLSVLVLVLVLKYLWIRRWHYYYASKLDGPFAWPIVGNGLQFFKGRNVFYTQLREYLETYPSVFTLWIGPDLHIVTSRPNDADIILTDFLEKSSFYEFAKQCFGNGVVTSPVSIWRGRRKVVNQTFNQRILNSYIETLVKHAGIFMNDLEKCDGQYGVKLAAKIWHSAVVTFCETLADIDPHSLKGVNQHIVDVRRVEEMIVERSCTPWLYPKFLFDCSLMGKEMNKMDKNMKSFINQIMTMKWLSYSSENHEDNNLRRKRYLNTFFDLVKKNELTENDVREELQTMLVAGTETSSYALTFAILILAMYPDVQEKINDELDSIFGKSDRETTLDDLNKMNYLARVIKETLRFFPPIPFVMRTITETIEIDSIVYPAGCNVIVAFWKIHRRPDLWPDPMKFDPDRFLPGEVEKRHRCAYMPFSHGARNCPGLQLGIMSMKIMLSNLCRQYILKPVEYKRIEDIELDYGVLMMPTDECKVILEKRPIG